mgnify:CR=1 FL=1
MIQITVIGLGLIGGSIAQDLRSQLGVYVIGVDANADHRREALSIGLVDEIKDLEESLSDTTVVILATPVHIIERQLIDILDMMGDDMTIIDVGSTKHAICDAVQGHPRRGQYVAAHPLAGTEFSGPQAAKRGLFQGAKNIICEKSKSDPKSLDIAIDIFRSLGMTSYYMTAEEHDRHLAYVSHLSHVTSFALGLTVLDIEKDEKQIFNLASTGFRSTSRLAKSNPNTWAAIFDKNSKPLIKALDGYIETLQKFRSAINDNDKEAMFALMKEANKIKRILK